MVIRFGTDGWRAVIADEFTFAAVRAVAGAYSAVLTRRIPGRRPRVVVGFDRRFESDTFARVAGDELTRRGVDVSIARYPVPTPAVSWAIVDLAADGGFVVTASHNPPSYNGVKIKTRSGSSAPPALCREIEAVLEGQEAPPRGDARGELREFDPIDSYLARLGRLVAVDRIRGAGLTVVADAMFGPTAGLLPRLLHSDSTDVVEINTAHNPLFPGLTGPEPIERNLARLKKVVVDGGAQIGVALDGDGDRLALVDGRGNYLPAQRTFALLARYMLDVRRDRRPIVKSATGSAMIDVLAARAGVTVLETPTGFSHISETMIAQNASLGGEESGGFAFGFHIPERDGLLAALLILDYTIQSGKHLSALVAELPELVGDWAYRRIDVPVQLEAMDTLRSRLKALEVPAAFAGRPVRRVSDIDGVKIVLEDSSWLLLRTSGTEPLLRLLAEAHDPETVDALLLAGQGLIGV